MAAAAARMAASQNHRNPDSSDISSPNHIPPYTNSGHPQGAAMAQQMHHIQQMMMKNNNSNLNSFSRPPQPSNNFIGYTFLDQFVLIRKYEFIEECLTNSNC